MEIETLIEKLKWAVNLYAQAGDDANTHKEYQKTVREARRIIMDEVVLTLEDMGHRHLTNQSSCQVKFESLGFL